MPEDCVGAGATKAVNPAFKRQVDAGVAKERAWVETVGETYFRPWGLHDAAHPCAFTLDAQSRDDIVRRNPSLRADDFHLARPRRPYLIVNGTVVGVGLGAGEVLSAGAGTVEVKATPRPYQLCDASGTSSAFLAGFAAQIPGGLADANPRLGLREPGDHVVPPCTYQLGDGGVVENFGLLALMRRKLPRAIVFINTSVPLNVAYDVAHQTPKDSDLDAYLPPFFGFRLAETDV